jgi:large subunit ribosomal protein L6
MSRVGKQPIAGPKGVKLLLEGQEGSQKIKVEGPKGKSERAIASTIIAKMEGDTLVLSTANNEKLTRAAHGLERALVANMVKGVSEGFIKELDLIGVGYRADMKGDSVVNLALGYSHPIDFNLPKGVKGVVVKEGRDTTVRLEGVDKQLVGQAAAQIRALRAPEPYKGKGVRYKGEVVKQKAGKAGKK